MCYMYVLPGNVAVLSEVFLSSFILAFFPLVLLQQTDRQTLVMCHVIRELGFYLRVDELRRQLLSYLCLSWLGVII